MKLKLADKLLVPGPGRDAAITEAKTRTSTAAQAVRPLRSAASCSSPTARLKQTSIWPFKLPNGALAHSVLSLRWVAGDWKVKASDDGQIFNGVAQLSDLSGFILWAGV